MISKALDLITEVDIAQLLENKVPESKTLDYKKELPGGKDEDKKEFLADVSSFSNTVGGDLVIGVREEAGVPAEIAGCEIPDPDAEIARLENILRDGLEPRISVALKRVPLENGRSVVVVRAPRSWIGPHRVTHGGRNRFYARNAAGKFEMDVTELRRAFAAGETASTLIADFRTERVAAIYGGKTPVPMFADNGGMGGRLILHLVPLESFTTEQNVDFIQFARDNRRLRPIRTNDWSSQINLSGVVSHSGDGTSAHAYTQLYRRGYIEAVKGPLFDTRGGKKMIFSRTYEEQVIEGFTRYADTLKEIGMNPPVALMVTLVGAAGCNLATAVHFDRGHPIEDDVIELPEVVLQSYDDLSPETLRPIFDMVWNAAGHERSGNFDKDGKWLTAT